MKKLALLTTTLLLTSCVNISGNLTVHSPIQLKDKKGRIKTLNPGDHKALIKFKSKKELMLKTTEGRNKKFIFKIPGGVKLPEENGVLSLTSSQVGQPYNVEGDIRTRYSQSARQAERQACSVSRQVQRCHRGAEGQRVCQTETITEHGFKRVAFHYNYKDQSLVVDLVGPQSGQIMAKFHGSEHTSTKVIDRSSPCRLRRIR